MTYTKEQIDLICPLHDRISCADNDFCNHHYNINGRRLPDCGRCYLLNCYYQDWFDPMIKITPTVQLSFEPRSCDKCNGSGVIE